MNLNNLFEDDNAKPGANYAEELAHQIFKVAPDLDATGVADEVLDYAFDLAVNDLGRRRAHSLFAYDQDFDSDLVSAYADLQRQDADKDMAESNSWDRLSGDTSNLDPEHLAHLYQQSEISRRTGLAVGDRVTLKDRPGFEGKIVHDWGGGDYTISGGGGGMKQSNNHRANARIIQKIQGMAEGGAKDRQWSNKDMERLRVATRDFDDIMASNGPEAFKQELIKKRIKTKPMAGPKGVLPEQGVAEGGMYGDQEVSWEQGGRRAPTGAFRNPNAEKMILHPETYDLIDEYIAKIEPDADREEIAKAIMSGHIHPSELEYALQDEDLNEFAPPGGEGGPSEDEILFRLAKQWWLGTEQDMIRAERTLASMGWEIGEDDGYDDGGVFVVRAGDENGKSYQSWSNEELEGLAEASWHSEPEQERMDAIRQSRLNREREPEGSEAIDARIRARHDQLDQYNQSGRFWLKQKDTQEHISDAMIGKAAANAAAAKMLKQRPELQGNLVITAYGPGESQGVSEDMTRRGFLRGVGAAALAGAAGAASAGGYVPGQPNDWKYNMGVKKPGADAAPAASPAAGSEQTVDFFKAQSAESRAAAAEAANAAAKIGYTNPKFREEYERIEKFYQQQKSIILGNKRPFSANVDLARRQYAESMKLLIAADKEFAQKTNALLKDYGALREADKKKEDEPEVRDVALQRAISRAKADFPAAGSGIEALAKDFMRSQDQDSKSFDQLRRAERKQDQMLGQIAKIDQEQGQEIQDLENQNSSLASRLQQLQNVNNDLEKKLAAMSGRRAEKTSKSADVSTTLAPVSTSTKAATPKATAKKKTADVEPTTSKAIGQIAKTLAPDASSLAFDRMSQELQPRQKELGFDEPVTIKPKKFDTSKASDAEYRELTSKIAKDIVSRPDADRVFNPNAMQGMSKQQEMPLENKDKPNKLARPEVDYDDPKWDAMVKRVGQLAKQGPRKTVWDPVKRVYKTVPVNK